MKKPGQLFNTSADLQMSDVRKGEVEDVFFVADCRFGILVSNDQLL